MCISFHPYWRDRNSLSLIFWYFRQNFNYHCDPYIGGGLHYLVRNFKLEGVRNFMMEFVRNFMLEFVRILLNWA